MATENMNAQRMRILNAQLVLRQVRQHGPVSRADIARHARLSSPTVSALVSELESAGLVEESGQGTSNGGRRPQLVSFNARCGVVVGGNIDRDSVQLVLADMEGCRLAKRTIASGASTRPGALLKRVAVAIESMRARVDAPLHHVVIGAPGMTDVKRGVVLEAAALENWVNVPAAQMLSDALGVPCGVDNDVNLSAIGELWRGAAANRRNFVFIHIGSGIGAGIVIDGQLHRGANWYAGEISHLNLDYCEWESDFGAFGYLEAYLTGHSSKSPKSATGSPKSATEPRKTISSNGSVPGLEDENTVLRLGTAIANIATVLDPETIIFGGPALLDHPELLGKVYRVAKRVAPNCPEFRVTALGEEAPVFGSLCTALNAAEASLRDQIVRQTAGTAKAAAASR